jgi:hypothetical protein
MVAALQMHESCISITYALETSNMSTMVKMVIDDGSIVVVMSRPGFWNPTYNRRTRIKVMHD